MRYNELIDIIKRQDEMLQIRKITSVTSMIWVIFIVGAAVGEPSKDPATIFFDNGTDDTYLFGHK